MTIHECYQAMGADYEEVLGRLCSESLIKKFVLKFPQDPSFLQLQQTLAEQDILTAFRAAHTLKGVSQNLGFTPLYETASTLTELLRAGNLPPDSTLFDAVSREYHRTIDAIAQLNDV